MRSVVLGCGNAASLENVSCVRKCCMRQKKCCMHQKMLYASANAVCVRKCCMRQQMLYASEKCCMRQQMLYASANAVCVRECSMRQKNAAGVYCVGLARTIHL